MILVLLLLGLAVVLAVRALSATAEMARRMSAVENRARHIEEELNRLRRSGALPADMAPAAPPPPSPALAPPPPPPAPQIPLTAHTAPSPLAAAAPAPRPEDHSTSTLEREIGSRWMLVAGVIVLVLGIAFFVKYAFDRHWINETARVAIGSIVGLAVWIAGLKFVRAGYTPFGRMIAGGGLAMMFVAAWAATALYGLVSTGLGFAWTIGVSALSGFTADRERSVGLALVAVIFGYAAPFLLPGTVDHHLVLFTYEGLLASAALFLVERHGWPALGLASWWLTWTTFASWLTRSYLDRMFVSTEIYLVFASSVFVAMLWIYQRRPNDPFARIAAYVLHAGPVLFHAASLYVLFNHPIAFLIYLIIGTALCVLLANDRPAVRLVVWLAIAAPFVSWIGRHATAGWYIPTLVTAAAIYVLHFWSALRNLGPTKPPRDAELVLFQFNAFGFFLFLYLALYAHGASTSLLAVVMAVWHLALAWRFRRRFAAAVPHALATAFVFIAIAIALTLTGPWVTVAYAAEGAAIVVVGLWSARGFFRFAGLALLAFAAWRLVVLQFGRTAVSFTPIANSRTLTGGFIVAMLYLVAWLYRRNDAARQEEARQAIVLTAVAANLLTVGLLTSDVNSFWTARPDQLTADFSRQLSISVTWATYAMAIIWIGFKRPSAMLRYLALALFAVTLGKVFTVDLLELAGVYRISGFIGLGLILLAASFLYQRQRPRTTTP